MKIKTVVLVVMLGIVGRVDAVDVYYVGSELLSDCESEKIGLRNDCVMYLAGTMDAISMSVEWGNIKTKFICKPKEVNLSQLRKIFVKYANENPQDLHHAAASLVLNAFSLAFPCK